MQLRQRNLDGFGVDVVERHAVHDQRVAERVQRMTASVRVTPPVVVSVICQRGVPVGGSVLSNRPETDHLFQPRHQRASNDSVEIVLPLAVTVTS